MTDKADYGQGKGVLIQRDIVINGIIKASALDISEEGMYIHTQAEFIKGGLLDLKMDINGGSVDLQATVVRSQPGIGIGVKFVNLSPSVAELIKDFMKRMTAQLVKGAEKVARKILLVDDSAQSRAIYRNKLNLEGFTVVDAADGVEALRHLHEVKFDLVILDLWMEGIDGFKVMQLMKLNPGFKDIPVIVLSARSVPSDVEKAIELGARDYLPKMTTTPVKLADKVKEVLSKTV